MDVVTFCRETRVLIVAGKGGTGKTTIAAALAVMAAEAGVSVLVVELEGKPGLHAALGGTGPLRYDEVQVGAVRARRVTPDDSLLEYLNDHGLQRFSKRLVASGLLEVVSTAIPGLRDVLVLGKIKQLERAESADLVIVDAPATGHAVTFLSSARGLLDAARAGPVRTQAAEVLEMLRDPSRCRLILITLPEELPVSETIEAAYQLEDRVGVQLGPLVVNRFDPLPDGLRRSLDHRAATTAGLGDTEIRVLEEAQRFRLRRHEVQQEQIDRLARELPLPQLRVPTIQAPSIGPAETKLLARSLSLSLTKVQPESVAGPSAGS